MKKWLTGLVLIGLPVVAMAEFGSSFHGGGHMMGYEGGFMFMGLFWLALLGVFIWLAMTFVKNSRSTGNAQSYADEAVNIVKNRFARGEITKEEMDELLSHLK